VNILVVEDEPLIRLGVVAMLEDAGFTAFEAANADDAIRRLERQSDIHLIITDIDMPGSMDGVKLAHYVRGRWPPIRLIVLSGKFKPAESDLPAGTQFFSKPYQERRLLGVVNEMAHSFGGSA
jgi:CheY-like chemotaxis protein